MEKQILKLLIQNQGLTEKIKYRVNKEMESEFVIDQYVPFGSVEKGFVYLISNEDIQRLIG